MKFLRRRSIVTSKVIALAAHLFILPVAVAQEEIPVIVNEETGEQVVLTPAYWNANVDIATRTVRCDHYSFDRNSNSYVIGGHGNLPNNTISYADFVHSPLLVQYERSYIQHPQIPNSTRPTWTVRDGIYDGLAPMSMGRYVELINYDPVARTINANPQKNAIRAWHNYEGPSASNFSTCYAVDDQPFIPTGAAGVGNTNLIDLNDVEDFTFQFPDPVGPDVELPVMYSPDTGERIQFVRGEWRYNEQLAGKTMYCAWHRWTGEEYRPFGSDDGGGYFGTTFFPYIGGDTVGISSWSDDFFYRTTGAQQVSSFNLIGYRNPLIELTADGFNLRLNGYGNVLVCRISDFEPSRLLPVQPDNCDYSDADQYDGWGWNQPAQISCPPQVTTTSSPADINTTDPSNVNTEEGSNNTTDTTCVDTDGDGFGWDGSSTCIPSSQTGTNSNPTQVSAVESECFDSPPLGDGWGWNGVTSCRVEAINQVCEDSPPVGDGWGWDGVTSCRIEATNQVCKDSPPVGDGWGWDGITSCRIETSGTTLTYLPSNSRPVECIDTAPIGNGWGWNGTESCTVIANLIKNGSFTDDGAFWTTYVHPDAIDTEFSITPYDSLGLFYQDAGSEWWHSQAYSTPFDLKGGKRYRLEFNNASSSKTGNAVGSVVIENSTTYNKLLDRQDFSINIGGSLVRIDFTAAESDNNARLTFNLGENAGGNNSTNSGYIWIDSVVLRALD